VRWIENAKKPETRAGRLQATLDGLRSGKRTHWASPARGVRT
jgi:Bacteriocin-protection, YdeI or OmpD-Associated